MKDNQLSIQAEMKALDLKDRKFYDRLNEENRKKFSTFLMIRYGATVTGIADLQAYYLQSCNLRLNKHFFSVNKTKHDKLNWLAATTISPGMGNQNHQWLAAPKKAASNNKVEKFLASLYPAMKIQDIALMASMNDLADIKKLAEQLGMDKAQIKKELGP